MCLKSIKVCNSVREVITNNEEKKVGLCLSFTEESEESEQKDAELDNFPRVIRKLGPFK